MQPNDQDRFAGAQPPWLSIVMPTYNGQAFVAQALASIAAECEGGIECVIVDDGSTDDTLGIVRSYSDRLNLNVLEPKRRGSWVAATNEGLRAARGELTCFLHQDDLWNPGRVALLREMVRTHPTASLYFHAAHYIDAQGKHLGDLTCPLSDTQQPIEPAHLISRLIVQNFIAINAPVFRRSDVLRLGCLNESLWYTADWDFWLRLAACGTSAYRPERAVSFRIHGGSLTVSGSVRQDDFRHQLLSVLQTHIRLNPQLTPRTVSLAQSSIQVNVALAQALHGTKWSLLTTLLRILVRGPFYLYDFARYTRLPQRVLARLRARLSAGPA